MCGLALPKCIFSIDSFMFGTLWWCLRVACALQVLRTLLPEQSILQRKCCAVRKILFEFIGSAALMLESGSISVPSITIHA